MEELNFDMLLYFLDSRPLEEVRVLVEQILGCQLRMRETDDRIDEKTFDGQVFGISISLSSTIEWPEGYVYWLRGGTLDRLYATGGRQVSLDSHISRLLRMHGISTTMTAAEFAKLDQEKFPEEYARLRKRAGLE
jgi:hypothetical protein